MIVVWRITEQCNLGCKFCGFDRELARPRKEADRLQILQFGAVLSQYQARMRDEVLVSWLGGEPLLRADLRGVTERFCNDYSLRISTTTNGTLLGSAKLRAHILDCYAELTVSVDAIGSAHYQLRGWQGGYTSLERNLTSLAKEKKARGSGPTLRANVLLMRQTIAGFEELCFKLAEWGIEEITFNQLGGNDRPEFYPDHRLLPDQVEKFCAEWPDLRSRLELLGVRLRGSEGYLRRIRATALGVRLPIEDCHPGENFLFIDSSGQVAPCSFTVSGYGVPIDEINALDDLLQLPIRFSNLRRNQLLTACGDCHSTQVFEKFVA